MDFDQISVEQFNENFFSLLDDPSRVKEAQQAAARFIRQKLREEGVMRRYFADSFERVTTEDPRYQIDPENSDTGYLLVDKEPDSYALKMTFRAQPQAEYVMNQKFIVPFAKYISPVFEKQEMELRNIRMPITDVIRANVFLDLQEKEDNYFFQELETALQINGNHLQLPNKYLVKANLETLLNMIETKRLRVAAFLMADSTLNNTLRWEHNDIGDVVERVVEQGVVWRTLFGKKLVTTVNTDVIPYGEVWALVSPEFLGVAAMLGDPTFWLRKHMDLLQMASWHYMGMNIGNVRGVARIRLAPSEGEGEE